MADKLLLPNCIFHHIIVIISNTNTIFLKKPTERNSNIHLPWIAMAS